MVAQAGGWAVGGAASGVGHATWAHTHRARFHARGLRTARRRGPPARPGPARPRGPPTRSQHIRLTSSVMPLWRSKYGDRSYCTYKSAMPVHEPRRVASASEMLTRLVRCWAGSAGEWGARIRTERALCGNQLAVGAAPRRAPRRGCAKQRPPGASCSLLGPHMAAGVGQGRGEGGGRARVAEPRACPVPRCCRRRSLVSVVRLSPGCEGPHWSGLCVRLGGSRHGMRAEKAAAAPCAMSGSASDGTLAHVRRCSLPLITSVTTPPRTR